jgi:hypothetical protein
MTDRVEVESAMAAYNAAFVAAFQANDPALVAHHYRMPLVFASAGHVQAYETVQAVTHWLRSVHGGLRARDYDHTEYDVDAVDILNAGAAALDLTFRLLDGAGKVFRTERSRYIFVKEERAWRVLSAFLLDSH